MKTLTLMFGCFVCHHAACMALCRPTVIQTQIPENDPALWTLSAVSGEPNTWDLEIDAPSAFTTTIQVIRSTPNEIIILRNVIIARPDSGRQIYVNLGRTSPTTSLLQSVSSIHTDLTPLSNLPGGYVHVDLQLANSGSSPSLGEVRNLNALTGVIDGGNVVGPIVAVTHPNSLPMDSTSDSNIQLQVVNGSLLGDVRIDPFVPASGDPVLGRIHKLDFQNGTIGTPESPVEIQADGVVEDVLAQRIHANITGTNTDPSRREIDSYVFLLGYVETFAPNNLTPVFTGEIRADRLGKEEGIYPLYQDAYMRISGRNEARIWLQEIQGGGDHEYSSPALTLTSNISLNCVELDAGPSVWQGPVKLDAGPNNNPPAIVMIGATDGQGYDRPASSLGGGAVGVVPFEQKRDDCFPLHEAIITDMSARPDPSNPIRLRHYGPVNWVVGTGIPAPFKVERRGIGGCAPNECWTDETSCFTLSLSDSGTVVDLTPTRALQRGYEYRVSLQTYDDGGTQKLVLRCDLPQFDAAEDPEVVAYDPMTFKVCDTAAPGDASDDGTVEFGDITSVLNNFGLTNCLKHGDANRDGDVDFADITAVLNNFNAEYRTTSLLMAGEGGSAGEGLTSMSALDDEGRAPATAAEAMSSVSDALAQMGYASIEAFVNAIGSMSEEDRNAEIRRLGALLDPAGAAE